MVVSLCAHVCVCVIRSSCFINIYSFPHLCSFHEHGGRGFLLFPCKIKFSTAAWKRNGLILKNSRLAFEPETNHDISLYKFSSLCFLLRWKSPIGFLYLRLVLLFAFQSFVPSAVQWWRLPSDFQFALSVLRSPNGLFVSL